MKTVWSVELARYPATAPGTKGSPGEILKEGLVFYFGMVDKKRGKVRNSKIRTGGLNL
jgi:hypothetical protein